MTVPAAARAFDEGADGYAATIGRTLLPVARRVVERATLQPRERVLDIGTGTGSAAAAALGEGRKVVGIDGAPGMIELARRNVPEATFQVMDFGQLEFADGIFDVVLASHSLLFADDRVAALAEWHRVTRPGGRLSLSIPGPPEMTPVTVYAEVYDRHGIAVAGRYPTGSELVADAEAAGWSDPRPEEDPSVVIRFADEALFRTWRSIGSRGPATRDWTAEQHEALTRDMLAVTPRDPDGAYVLPFGAVYLAARRPG